MRLALVGFGLVGLLVTLAIYLKLSTQNAQTTLQAGKEATQKALHIAGRDESGTPLAQTYALAADLRPDGKVKDLRVTRVDPGSPMEKFFGLKVNDLIVKTVYQGNTFATRQAADEESARLDVLNAYTYSGPPVVTRDGRELTLPLK